MNVAASDGALKQGTISLPLTLAQLDAFDVILDVRSPSEYAVDHLPGALNVPVLDDVQRVKVGILHKQTSAFEARKVGAALVARNIATHLEHLFVDKPKNWQPLVYCWRGGSRSIAMTLILRRIGWNALQLEGGYKAWRRQILRDLDQLPQMFSYRVICGRTGSGKSRLLAALDAAGAQVLDLEQYAAHKGSVLGEWHDTPQPSQKMFESRIWHALSRFDSTKPVYIEAESQKIGLLRVPQTLIECMRAAICYEIILAQDARVSLLCEEYAHLIANPALLFSRLDCLRKWHSREHIAHWKTLAEAERWDEFVTEMLTSHYDPAYCKSMYKNYRQAAQATLFEMPDASSTSFAEIARHIVTIQGKRDRAD